MPTTPLLLRIMLVAAKVLAAAVLLLVLANLAGEWRWRRVTAQIRARMPGPAAGSAGAPVELARASSVPPPVERYLRAVLPLDARPPTVVEFRHSGDFNMGEESDRWLPFTSSQLVRTSPPAFDWNAHIRLTRGLGVRVHDAYVEREGILRASLLGLVDVAHLRDTTALARGELMRFLAESPWYPWILLPGGDVSWEAVDDASADATLTADGHEVTLRFTFGADSLVATVHAAARDRSVGGVMVPTPWEGRFWDYALRDGVRVPVAGEVAWLLPEGRKPYWRARLDR